MAAHRHRVVAHPPVAGRHVRTVAWIALAIGMSVVLAALVAVLAIAASIGVLSADLLDPLRLGSLASTITDLTLELA